MKVVIGARGSGAARALVMAAVGVCLSCTTSAVTPTDEPPPVTVISARGAVHRLNTAEYNATVADVLGTKLEPATASWRGGELLGFDNMAPVLSVDEPQYARYFEAAKALSADVVSSEELRARFVDCDLRAGDCASASIQRAGFLLFRRPLTSEERDIYLQLNAKALSLGDSPVAAFELVLQALLASAQFVYRIELPPRESQEPTEVGPFELASRLSYFLWSSARDAALLDAAADGSLSDADTLTGSVDRMLADPRASRFVERFAGQWLGARLVGAHAAVPELYEWSPQVARAAGEEIVYFFGELVHSDRSWLEFLTADVNYVTEPLARYYRIPTPEAARARVEHHPDQRAGFLGLAGFLAVSSFDRRTGARRRAHATVARVARAALPARSDAGAATALLAHLSAHGAHEFWHPLTAGKGESWRLSSVLEPFGALKAKLNVVSNLENGSVFHADASPLVDPSHSRLAGAWLTCVDAAAVRAKLGSGEANGVSIDQILAKHPAFQGQTALPSLQVGLSTALGDCDGEPCSSSRSVSWASDTQPMYKLVDPLEVWSALVGVASGPTAGGAGSVEAQKRLVRDKSVLDAVLESAHRIQQQLGASDRQRLEEFLTSVRAVERRVTGVSVGMGGRACLTANTPSMARVEQSAMAPTQTTETYDKARHADAMNDLITMAFECDATRIISYMLEDERSAFTYDHVEERAFTVEGSKGKGGTCPEYHLAQHMGGDVFASITWWNVVKVAELCRKLDAIEEAPGVSVLDNCVVMLGGCMHGGNHQANQLPLALVGGKNLGLEQDQHLTLEPRPLRDLYYTLVRDVFGADISELGQNLTGAPLRRVDQLLRA